MFFALNNRIFVDMASVKLFGFADIFINQV